MLQARGARAQLRAPGLVALPGAAKARMNEWDDSPADTHDRVQSADHTGAIEHLNQLWHPRSDAVPTLARPEVLPDPTVDLNLWQPMLLWADNSHTTRDELAHVLDLHTVQRLQFLLRKRLFRAIARGARTTSYTQSFDICFGCCDTTP